MHIAIEASTWVNLRGYGRFTRELTRALVRAKSDHEFTLVLDSGAAAATDLPEIRQIVVPTRQAVVSAAIADRSRSIADMWRMSAALSSRRFDAVVFPTNYSFVPVFSGAIVVVVVHDTLPESMPEIVLGSKRAQWFWHLKSRLACSRAQLLATVSDASATEIRARLPVGSKRITVLTEGVSSVFSAGPTADDVRLVGEIAGPGPFILFVGGLSPHKRVPELVRAFGAIANRDVHAGLRLVLAGPGQTDGFESDHASVERALVDIGPAACRVVRTGFVADATLAALYRQALCVVLPSTAEGFGLPALEAMASGTPLVVTRNAALEEVCGGAALFVDDIKELGSRLSDLLVDPSRREALSRAGLERAQRFGWDEAAQRLLDALVRARRGRDGLLNAY